MSGCLPGLAPPLDQISQVLYLFYLLTSPVPHKPTLTLQNMLDGISIPPCPWVYYSIMNKQIMSLKGLLTSQLILLFQPAFQMQTGVPRMHPFQLTKNARNISLEETRSMCGFILFMGGTPIMWKCIKEKRSSRSSCEVEIKAADECVRSIQFVRNVLTDMGFEL